MVVSCCIVAVTRYFDKRRGIALGLNLAGPPMASLLLPKLLEWLLGEFGLRGTFLILGGCMANVPVLGILLRKPPWEKSVGEGVDDKVEDPCCEAVKGGAQRISLPLNQSNVNLCDRISAKGSPMAGGGGRRSTKTSVPHCSVRFIDRKTIPTIIPTTGTASKETGASANMEHHLFARARPLVSPAAFFHRVPAEYADRKRCWGI
ncbi:hypothetical protein HPB50_023025 [Hyalomma asiaticum]|uniref:Uncharacterized protein n=1 Tax=Hyalomma asiaticum TaxID=266040 RepID=A0ACB7SK87_HYAAI|nr:hypothetical protein HPB50_023025 [Hyalomma asiaticum]